MSDRAYLAWVRSLPCLFEGGDCDGPIDAHHRTGGGMALKVPDDQTLPLCRQHHMDRHALRGPFLGWDKATVKQWEVDMVAQTQSLRKGLPESF